MKTIILSIGFLTIGEVECLCRNKNIVFYCYDPCPSVYVGFSEMFGGMENVHYFPDAVSFYRGKANLNLNGTASELVDYTSNLTTEVNVVSIQDVIYMIETEQGEDCEFGLLINCEGEEVPLIMMEPVETFTMFKDIKIEFHPHLYNDNAIYECVKKLSQRFDYSRHFTSKKNLPVYIFQRRNNVE